MIGSAAIMLALTGVGGVLGGFVGTARAQSSTSAVTYQGVLTQNGTPVADGAYTLTFKIYDAASGGNVVETINVPGVATTQGRFSAAVPVTPSSFNGADRWWSVTFGGTELPTQKVTATPYAIRASTLLDSRGYGILANSSNSARLGVNTTPDALLHVQGFNANIPSLLVQTDMRERAPLATSAKFSFTDDLNTFGEFDINYKDESGNFAIMRAAFGGDVKAVLGTRGNFSCKTLTVLGEGNGPNDIVLNCAGRAQVQVLTITGADVAEPFQIAASESASSAQIVPQPGMVVSIDPNNPGKLAVSSTPYDKKVAGVISGAGGLSAGVVMGQENTDPLIMGDHPVAMTGRVYVWCDASFGAIEPGSLLTTSSTIGHAMVATEQSRAFGSVIGKAMTRLQQGKGLVLVLVNLQ